MLEYRKDIDGLRALAILPVVLFHLDLDVFSGGFIGVDVFFVISGYLITSIVIHQIGNDNFSIIDFYDRRIRRILPAYFFICGIFSIFGFLLLMPEDLESFGKSLIYTSIFISNHLFSKSVNYFDTSLETSPLLHIWSLSVEEQFYVIWPLFLVLGCRYLTFKHLKYLAIIIFAISLAASEYFLKSHPKLSFFLLPFRAWELGLGTLLAMNIFPSIKTRWINEVFYALGLGVIIGAIFYLSPEKSFPGLNAIMPCLGAALVIYAGTNTQTVSSNLLTLKPIVLMGLISYSLYLWHWPFIILSKYVRTELLPHETAIIFGLSITLSYFSWKYIETPFRKRKSSKASDQAIPVRQKERLPKSILAAVALSILFFSVGFTFEKTEGLKWRFNNIAKLQDAKEFQPLTKICLNDLKRLEIEGGLEQSDCIVGIKNKNYDAILFGDSHANHYAPAVNSWASQNGLSVLQLSLGGCLPFFGDLQRVNRKVKKTERCRLFKEKVLGILQKKFKTIRLVIFAGRWSLYTETDRGTNKGGRIFLIDSLDNTLSRKNSRRVFKKGLKNTVDIVKSLGMDIWVLGQIPFNKDPDCMFKLNLPIQKVFPLYKKSKCGRTDRAYVENRTSFANQLFLEISQTDPGINYFSPINYLCSQGFCFSSFEGNPLYRDNNHLNYYGGKYMARFFDFKPFQN
jgi:peptidoglycan/LPS O-acetylase OafA/YrhL